jgi:hypothetical protein
MCLVLFGGCGIGQQFDSVVVPSVCSAATRGIDSVSVPVLSKTIRVDSAEQLEGAAIFDQNFVFGCEEKRIEEADCTKVAQLAEGVEVDHGGSRVGAEQRQGEGGGTQCRDYQPVGQLVHTQLVGAAVVSCLGQELANPAGQGGRWVLFDPHLQPAGEQQGRCKDPILRSVFPRVDSPVSISSATAADSLCRICPSTGMISPA